MDKPANLFVHPLVYDEKNNCLSFLRTYKPAYLGVNSKNYDRGLLYRLDFETSGVLVYVKNEIAYQYLRENFKTIAKKKTYGNTAKRKTLKLLAFIVILHKEVISKGKNFNCSTKKYKGIAPRLVLKRLRNPFIPFIYLDLRVKL